MVIKMSKPVVASGGKTDELHLPQSSLSKETCQRPSRVIKAAGRRCSSDLLEVRMNIKAM